MEIKDWIMTGLGILFGLLSFIFKREMERISEDNNELNDMVKNREERNYQSHKEIWDEQNKLRERVSKVEAIQDRCSTCRGE
jgi:uncharacterized protein YdcH (DUF465 family)